MLEERFIETDEEGFTPRLSRFGGPVLLPTVERRRGRLVGATVGGRGVGGWARNGMN